MRITGDSSRQHSSLFTIATVALSYFILGRFGLLLAVPPGYATAIWPAAGLALYAVLTFRSNAWFGIWLGSFLVNTSVGIEVSDTTVLLKALIVAAVIAVGASLQAVVTAAFLNKAKVYPSGFNNIRTIAFFVFIGAPLGAIINATVGTTTLLSFSLIHAVEWGFSWWTWWIGDALGVIILTPILIVWHVSEKNNRLRAYIISATTGVSSLLVISLFIWMSHHEVHRLRTSFQDDSIAMSAALRERLERYTEIMLSVKRFVEGTSTISEKQFHNFIDPIITRHPQITAIAWDELVHNKERKQYEKDNGFQMLDVRPDGTHVQATERPEYVIVRYISPKEQEPELQGINVGGLPDRLEALEAARRSGKATATRKISLVQRGPEEPATLIIYPVYEDDAQQTEDTKERELRGYVVIAFTLNDVINPSLKTTTTHQQIGFEIIDETDPDHLDLLSSFDPLQHNPEQRSRLHRFVSDVMWTTSVSVAGRSWRLRLYMTPLYLAGHRSLQAWAILAAGMLFTGLLGAFMLFVTGSTEELQRIVQFRTNSLSELNIQLAEKERLLEQFVRHTPIATAMVDKNLRYIVVSEQWNIMYGDGRHDLTGQLYEDVIPRRSSEHQEIYRQLLEGTLERYSGEDYVERIPGQGEWVKSIVRPWHDEKGIVEGLVFSVEIITDRKESEQATQEARNFLHLVLDQLPAAVFVKDGKEETFGQFRLWNKASEAVFGISREDAIGKKDIDFFPLDQVKFFEEKDRSIFERGIQEDVAEEYIDSISLGRRILHTVKVPIFDNKGDPEFLLGISEDITERKRVEKALRESEEALRRAVQAKNLFLANMSHEIRTPLTSIIGFAESVLSEELTKEQSAKALETVLRNGRHLLGVLNDILDLSKIEAGRFDVEILNVDLLRLIGEVVSLMQPKAHEKGIAFSVEYEYPLPRFIQTDPTRLKQILINLIGNAIKFTTKGSVTLRVACNKEKEKLSFIVQDTGIGLSDDQLSRLFSAFTQGDTSITREYGGTGLGLVISHDLAKRLGGEISVKSVVKEGSTFTAIVNPGGLKDVEMIVSHAVSNSKEPVSIAAAPKLSGRVLLAEDGSDTREYMSLLLRKAEIEFSVVENGLEAVKAATKSEFNLILMDIQMPVMDGYTATRTLREQGCKVPIVACTANTMRHEIDECLKAGCTGYLGKPFDRKSFFDVLTTYLSSEEKVEQNPLLSDFDEKGLAPIIRGFLDKLPGRVTEIEEAASLKDWEEVKALAHRLKNATLFGFPALGSASSELEMRARELKEDEAREVIKRIRQLANQMVV